MDGSDKDFSSSKPSSTPKFSTTGGTNENEQNYDKNGSKCQNPKKPPMKHFMPPTTSAASKVQAPRKKILAESNKISNFSDTNLHTSPNLDSKRSSESGDDEQNNSVSDSSSKPYDPFTNYLSPRPKFLRYKPNRCRKIFLSQEYEILKEKNGSGVKAESSVDGSGHSSLIPTLQEGSEKQEGEEITIMTKDDLDDDADEDIEEFEKENCLSLKGVYEAELEKKEGSIEEDFDQLEGIETVETAEKSESFQDCQIPYVSDNHRSEKSEGEDTIEEIDDVAKQVVENKVARVGGHTENVDGEIVTTDGLDSGNTEAASGISEGVVNSVEVTIKHAKTDLIPGIVIGFSMFLALSVLGFHWKRKKTHVKQSLLTKNPIADSVLAEKISQVGPVYIEKVESFVKPSSLIRLTEETSKDFHQIGAPTVELLGEFEVGGVSISIRSCNMKSKIMENEMSYYSGIKEKRKQIESNVVSSQVRPSASDLSTRNSPSYGSFTAEKKIVKKEGKYGEVKAEIITPVRQSSRIRNREVMSP